MTSGPHPDSIRHIGARHPARKNPLKTMPESARCVLYCGLKGKDLCAYQEGATDDCPANVATQSGSAASTKSGGHIATSTGGP
jgi:hypothetical protein